MAELLIYGATGYTGRMIARRAVAHRLDCSVAGRDAGKVEALASELGVEGAAFDVDDKARLEEAVGRAKCVVNAAGPFAATARQVIGACLAKSAHYLDITGEVDVFILAESCDAEARAAGVMLMPGAGWDVVPSDCIALHAARRVADVRSVRIGLAHVDGQPSRGTLRTGLSMAGRSIVRRGGALVELSDPGPGVEMDFGFARRECMLAPMGDVVTAARSTGAPDIAVYTARMKGLGLPEGGLEAFPEGPSDEQLARWRAFAAAEAVGADGARARSVVETESGYGFTAAAAAEIAARILAGRFTPGFQSPASAYGVDLVTDLGGTITDLD